MSYNAIKLKNKNSGISKFTQMSPRRQEIYFCDFSYFSTSIYYLQTILYIVPIFEEGKTIINALENNAHSTHRPAGETFL